MEFIQAPTDQTLIANSSIAKLMQKMSTNDGSNDNIIDKSNCFNIKLPIDVTANNIDLTVNTQNDYDIIEYIFDDSDDDIDILNITYPITIVLEDFTEIEVNSSSKFYSHSNTCKGENETDDDIECLDFLYPISASVFNKNNEIIQTVTLNTDKELNHFITLLNKDDLVSINFPVNVVLTDDALLSVNNLNELEDAINTHKNDCDEDDDFDYNDDDCDDCNIKDLTAVLTNCNGWTVDKLKRYNYNYDDAYNDYTFNFHTDGTITVYYANNTEEGTWTASGTGNNLTVIIDIPELPYCNNDWILHEISEYTETRIDFRVGDGDRMRYNNNCN
ncbi:hypothetical protein GCM10022395_35260 [Snuella lapsa]|uniref:Uncharacterized protein n=2 Tax=Snuella lapsa TaxID=870481 RepID=A0ABP6YN93_9FLAO